MDWISDIALQPGVLYWEGLVSHYLVETRRVN